MTLIVDSCVAIKWVLEENSSEFAVNLLNSNQEILAPDFIFLEVLNIIWKKINRTELPPESAEETFSTIKDLIHRIVPISHLHYKILSLSHTFNHPIYDCVYLAVAEDNNALMVTADKSSSIKSKKALIRNISCGLKTQFN